MTRLAGFILAGWLLGLLMLFLAGSLLSWMSVRTIHRPTHSPSLKIARAERLVRSLYQMVIILTSAYYYLSILLIILLVVGTSAGLIYLFSPPWYLSFPLVMIAGSLALPTLYLTVKDALIPLKENDLGRSLSQAEAPALWSLAQEVAMRSGTRPVDAIYITPASRIGVTERDSLLKMLLGSGQRSLV
jgi:hypothetical protein